MKNERLSVAGKWMELEIVMLRKMSQVQKAHQMFSFLCGT
jgi:hypothetical protein